MNVKKENFVPIWWPPMAVLFNRKLTIFSKKKKTDRFLLSIRFDHAQEFFTQNSTRVDYLFDYH